MNRRGRLGLLVLAAGASLGVSEAATLSVDMFSVSEEGVGEAIGTVTLEDFEGGLLLTPQLKGLPAGPRGFHVHEHPSCEPASGDGEIKPAMAAGGHYDPEGTDSHQGPYGQGHLGDLPILYVRADGSARDPVFAPRLSVEKVRGRSLMVHSGGDTYSDEPKDGGGGERVACGPIPRE